MKEKEKKEEKKKRKAKIKRIRGVKVPILTYLDLPALSSE